MNLKETEELALCFSTFLNEVKPGSKLDSAECSNLSIEMVKHIIKKFPSVRKEMFWNGDGELLEGLGINRIK